VSEEASVTASMDKLESCQEIINERQRIITLKRIGKYSIVFVFTVISIFFGEFAIIPLVEALTVYQSKLLEEH